MLIEDKIKYYKRYFEDCGLPEGVSYQEFFDLEMIDFINKNLSAYFGNNDWIELFKIYANNEQAMDNLVEIFCEKNSDISKNDFNTLMNDSKIRDSFMKSFTAFMNANDFAKLPPLSLIFNNSDLLDQIVNNDSIDISKISGSFKMILFDKENALKIINDHRFLNILFNYNTNEFLSFIRMSDWDISLKELMDRKMESLSYKEKIDVISKCFDPTTGQPEIFQDMYFTFEEKINRNIQRDSIIKLGTDSTLEEKEAVKSFVSTPTGQEIFLKEVLEPQFSNVINILNLDNSFYQKRKEALYKELSNYSQYDIETVKNLLCVYCFEDNPINVSLRLKTLIEYASENDDALLMMKDDMSGIVSLYSYLQKGDLETSPLDLLNNINLDNLIKEAHMLFSSDVNKGTDITDILSSNDYKEIDGVKVVDVDIPFDRSYFLVHSISKSDVGERPLESYLEMASNHSKFCTSILDNEHCNTFLDGVILGYCNIDNPIYSAVPFDGQTNQRNYKPGVPQFRSVLSSLDHFMKRTTDKYNEVTYLTNQEVVMPSYLLVVDNEPNELQLKVAKDFNIPIFIYHTKEREHKNDTGYNKPECFVYETKALEYMPNENTKRNIITN